MSALSIQPTYPIFTETDGQPLENGYIWIGQANLDPEGNPIAVFWDAALTQPAGQPIRTFNGYPFNSGTPARLYVNSDYSIRVMNKNGSVVYSAPAATERYSDVVVSGVNAEDVIYDPPFVDGVQTNVEAKLAQTVSVKDFGAVGDGVTDDTAAIHAAIDATKNGPILFFPSGVYYCTSTLTIGRGSKLQGENLAVPDPRSLSQDATKIKFAGGVSGVEVDQADLEDGYVWGIAIENLYFESVIGDNGPIGINLQKVAQSRFKNIGCERFTVGLKITLGMDNTFDSCSLQRCGTTSLLLADTDGVTTTQRFVDCVFRESDWAAQLTTSGSYMLDTVFDHCAFESTNIEGVSVHKGCSVTFIEPYFENVSAAASSLSGTAIRLYVDGSSSRADTLSVCNIFGGDISGPNTGSGFANALVYVGASAAAVNIVGGLYQRALHGVQVDASCKDFVVNADNPSFVSVTNVYTGTDSQRIGTWPTGVLTSSATRKRSYWKYLTSPLGIGQTSPETNVSSDAILGFGASGKWLLSQDATVAQTEYVDLGLNTGGGSFTGLLLVTNVATANTAFRTHTVFFCAGRGTDAVATSISTDDGPGAASFTVSFPSTGVVRVTNNYAGNTRLDVAFFGNQGA